MEEHLLGFTKVQYTVIIILFVTETDDVITLPMYMKNKSASLKNKRRFSFKNIQEAHAAKV